MLPPIRHKFWKAQQFLGVGVTLKKPYVSGGKLTNSFSNQYYLKYHNFIFFFMYNAKLVHLGKSEMHQQSFSVPCKNTVMLSFKMNKNNWLDVKLNSQHKMRLGL